MYNMWEEIQHQISIENQPQNADLGSVFYDCQFGSKIQFDKSRENTYWRETICM